MTHDALAIDLRINGPTWLVLACDIDHLAPEAVLPWFLEPGRLRRWWGEEYEIDPQRGGSYMIRWPSIGRTLRGQIASIGSTHLVFSWSFDEEPGVPAYVVALNSIERDGGATLEISHGAYRDDATGVAERQSHLEGWSFFLPRLLAAIRTQQ